MIYFTSYNSPIGKILLAERNNKLVCLSLNDDASYLAKLNDDIKDDEKSKTLIKTKDWLDRYFKGQKPLISELDIELIGTPFQKAVWQILIDIPYGQVITYNDIAGVMAKKRHIAKMSAQAVGRAVGSNPISIIIPCHRVIGMSGSLTGYAWGLDIKKYLLKHEGHDINKFKMPRQKEK